MKYLKIGYFFSKELLYYSYSLIVKNIWLLMSTFVVSNIVIYGMSHSGLNTIGGISITLYVWYMFFNQLFLTNWRDKDMINDIKSGNIITFLNKPVNYFFFQLSQGFFRNLIRIFLTGTISGIIIFGFLQNFPWYGLIVFLLSISSLLLGMLSISLLSIFLGLFAFKFEDSGFMRFILSKCIFILGGAFFPVDIYPLWLKLIAKYLPFQYFFYCPSKFFVTGDLGFFLSFFPLQVVWLIILILLNYFFYYRLVKTLEINGG